MEINDLEIVLFRGKPLIVMPDETIDILNRKVLNVLIGVAGEEGTFRIVSTKFVDKCDSITVCKHIIDSLHSVSVDTSQVVCLKSDNAKYMLAAGRTLHGLCER